MARRAKRRPVAEINVVPYIDVMLVLLIIFMATTPLLTPGVDVDLPKADAEPISAEELEQIEPLIVTVNAQGEYFINQSDDPESPVAGDVLARRTTAVLGFEPKTRVLIRGDSNARHGDMVQAMVLLQNAGAAKVGFITQPTDAAPANASETP